jgi:hypothetical protein
MLKISSLYSKVFGGRKTEKEADSAFQSSRNLLKNPNGDDSFNHWCFIPDSAATSDVIFTEGLKTRSGAKKAIDMYRKSRVLESTSFNDEKRTCRLQAAARKWSIEQTQPGAFADLLDSSSNTGGGGHLMANFVTSSALGEKMQCIDLAKEGLGERARMQHRHVRIDVAESYTARNEIPCFYHLAIFLFDKQFRLLDSFKHFDRLPCLAVRVANGKQKLRARH